MGLARARGEWVAFLDDDDMWAPHKLRTQVAAMRRSQADWSYCGVVDVDPTGHPLAFRPATATDGILRRLISGNVVHAGASTVIARTRLLRELGGFDEALFQCADWDMWLRLAAAGDAVACPEPLVGYVLHTANMALTDPNDVFEEFRHIRAKHADLAKTHGAAFDPVRFHAWTAAAFRRGRRPGAAARESLRAAIAGRSPGHLLRALASLMGTPGQRFIDALDAHHRTDAALPGEDALSWLPAPQEQLATKVTIDPATVAEIRRSRRYPKRTQFDYLHIRSLVRDLEAALGALPDEGPIQVLDIFCGSRPYDDLLPAGANATGLDIDDRYGCADVVSSDFLPFPDTSFDAVMCIEALHYVPDPRQAADEIMRVLKPGGHLVVAVPLVWEYDRSVLEHRWTGPSLANVFRDWEDVRVVENGGRAVAWSTLTGEMLAGAESALARGPARRPVRALFAGCYVLLNAIGAGLEFLDSRASRSGRTLPMNLLLTARRPQPR